MGRRPEYQDQELLAYQFYIQRPPGQPPPGPTAIRNAIKRAFPDPAEVPSLATIKKWLEKWRHQNNENTKLDAPFEWHRLEEYGLPWESSDFLLDLWCLVKEGQIWRWGAGDTLVTTWFLVKEGEQTCRVADLDMPPPTVRQVRWWWRVHVAAPEVPLRDLWYLAQRFVSRELAHHLLGVPLEMADLAGLLAYKPWKGWPDDKSNLLRYRYAVEAGRIPPLRGSDQVLQDAAAIGEKTNTVEFFLASGPDSMPWKYPELLHSQQIGLAAVAMSEAFSPESLKETERRQKQL